MAVDYACERCGYTGRDLSEDDIDRVQCSQCGEPVVPVGP